MSEEDALNKLQDIAEDEVPDDVFEELLRLIQEIYSEEKVPDDVFKDLLTIIQNIHSEQ